LLEIFGSIINGFTLPLKPEHKQFMMKVLMPLHKPKYMTIYHPQLSYCITQFVEKDPTLAFDIVQGLVRFWPRSCSKKEVMFLNELEEILERLTVNELEATSTVLFRQLSKCVQSTHFQVAERAICLLNYDILLRYISSHREQTMPLLLRALQVASSAHWNPTVCELTSNNLRLLMEMDEAMAQKYAAEFIPRFQNQSQASLKRQAAWDSLEASLGASPASLSHAPALNNQQRAMLSHRASLTSGPLALRYSDARAAASVLGLTA
jgi:serine/threonine-protein phosphatase 2A regulatory subunit B'